MIKKLAIISAMLVMFLSFAACDSSEEGLADYKAAKSVELQAYANDKGEHNFSDEGWSAVCKAVAYGKEAIEEAKSKADVDAAIATAKARIDEVKLKGEISFEEVDLGGELVRITNGELMKSVIYNQQELMSFFAEQEIVWVNNLPIWERYGSEFKSHAFLLYFAVTPSMSVSYYLDAVTMTDNLTLHIIGQLCGDILVDAEGLAMFIIKVGKSDIEGARTFEVEVKEKSNKRI